MRRMPRRRADLQSVAPQAQAAETRSASTHAPRLMRRLAVNNSGDIMGSEGVNAGGETAGRKGTLLTMASLSQGRTRHCHWNSGSQSLQNSRRIAFTIDLR